MYSCGQMARAPLESWVADAFEMLLWAVLFFGDLFVYKIISFIFSSDLHLNIYQGIKHM